MIVRGPALVETGAGGAVGMARSSRLAEILFGETLKAGSEARTAHPNPPSTAPDHSTLLNAAERRVVTEWMDLGGQYVNNPFDGGVRAVVMLSQATFEAQVYPVLQANCAAGCHQAGGTGPTPTVSPSFRGNRYILTGSPEGDYNVTLSMISNTCMRGRQLPAQPALDRAASARRDDADDGSAADGQRRLHGDSELDLDRMSDTLKRTHPRRLRTRRHARRLRRQLEPSRQSSGRSRTRRAAADRSSRSPTSSAASTRSSWRSCRSTRATSARSTPAPAPAATTTPTAPAASFRVVSNAAVIDVTDPANSADVIRATDMYKNFYSAQAAVVLGSPTREPAARPSRWCKACCTAAASSSRRPTIRTPS